MTKLNDQEELEDIIDTIWYDDIEEEENGVI